MAADNKQLEQDLRARWVAAANEEEDDPSKLQAILETDGLRKVQRLSLLNMNVAEGRKTPASSISSVPLQLETHVRTALCQAIRAQHNKIVQWLLSDERTMLIADESEGDYMTPLGLACRCHNMAAAKLLLDRGVDVNEPFFVRDRNQFSWGRHPASYHLTGYTPLHAVCRRAPQNVAFVDMLVMAGAEVNTNATRRHVDGLPTAVGLQLQQTPLLDVCQSRSDACARRLIEHGADIGIQLGGVPLVEYCVARGMTETLSALLERGLDPNAPLKFDGRTALHVASREGQVSTIRLLLDAGACASFRDAGFRTSLHLGAYSGSLEVVQLLLHAGAPVNALDVRGYSALHAACASRCISAPVLQCLFAAGLEAESKEDIAWYLVRRGKSTQAAMWLLTHDIASPDADTVECVLGVLLAESGYSSKLEAAAASAQRSRRVLKSPFFQRADVVVAPLVQEGGVPRPFALRYAMQPTVDRLWWDHY